MARHAIDQSNTHMVQLDGLRAFAVFGVIAEHSLNNTFGSGYAGVQLFFVMSGFLITGILLRARNEAERTQQSRGRVIGAFYVRRILRIFPVYYVVLGLVLWYKIPAAVASAPWHLCYLTNVYRFVIQGLVGPLSHFWSLAVEEQFYLVWPVLVVFVPRRLLSPFFGTVVISAPVFRASVFQATGYHSAELLTPGCLDTLGIGALLAYFWESWEREQIHRFCRWCLAVGLSSHVLLKALSFTDCLPAVVGIGLTSTTLALVFVWLVNRAAGGFRGPVGMVLSWPPVVYLGTISYGLYVWHAFCLEFVWRADLRLRLGLEYLHDRGIYQLLWMIVFSLVAATCSWFLFERPLNRLKRYFPYLKRELDVIRHPC